MNSLKVKNFGHQLEELDDIIENAANIYSFDVRYSVAQSFEEEFLDEIFDAESTHKEALAMLQSYVRRDFIQEYLAAELAEDGEKEIFEDDYFDERFRALIKKAVFSLQKCVRLCRLNLIKCPELFLAIAHFCSEYDYSTDIMRGKEEII